MSIVIDSLSNCFHRSQVSVILLLIVKDSILFYLRIGHNWNDQYYCVIFAMNDGRIVMRTVVRSFFSSNSISVIPFTQKRAPGSRIFFFSSVNSDKFSKEVNRSFVVCLSELSTGQAVLVSCPVGQDAFFNFCPVLPPARTKVGSRTGQKILSCAHLRLRNNVQKPI